MIQKLLLFTGMLLCLTDLANADKLKLEKWSGTECGPGDPKTEIVYDSEAQTCTGRCPKAGYPGLWDKGATCLGMRESISGDDFNGEVPTKDGACFEPSDDSGAWWKFTCTDPGPITSGAPTTGSSLGYSIHLAKNATAVRTI